MASYLQMVRKAGPPLEEGEILIDARRCMPKGATLVQGLAVGGATGAANAGVALGSVKKAGDVLVKGVEGYEHFHHGASTNPPVNDATRFPPGGVVIAVTNKRFLLFSHQQGVWRGTISYLRSEPLTWLSRIDVHARFSAPRIDITFADGSRVARELPRDSWGRTAGRFVQNVRAAQSALRGASGSRAASP